MSACSTFRVVTDSRYLRITAPFLIVSVQKFHWPLICLRYIASRIIVELVLYVRQRGVIAKRE